MGIVDHTKFETTWIISKHSKTRIRNYVVSSLAATDLRVLQCARANDADNKVCYEGTMTIVPNWARSDVAICAVSDDCSTRLTHTHTWLHSLPLPTRHPASVLGSMRCPHIGIA